MAPQSFSVNFFYTEFQSHPDAGMARVIQQDIYRINGRMPLATQLKLARMRAKAESLASIFPLLQPVC